MVRFGLCFQAHRFLGFPQLFAGLSVVAPIGEVAGNMVCEAFFFVRNIFSKPFFEGIKVIYGRLVVIVPARRVVISYDDFLLRQFVVEFEKLLRLLILRRLFIEGQFDSLGKFIGVIGADFDAVYQKSVRAVFKI